MVSDEDLYRDFLIGNQHAFEEIVDRYAEKLIFFIYSFVGNIDISQDLSQDVFLYILSKREKYKFKCSLKSYLFMIGKCRALNYLKKEKGRIELNEDYLYGDEILESVEDIVCNNINSQKMLSLILKLKKEQCEVVYLADIEGLSYKEISKVLGKTQAQVRMLLYRGRRKLKSEMLKASCNK